MRVAAGICTWQDGDALANCVRTLRGAVDEIVIADGLIDGIDADGLPAFTDRLHLHAACPDAHVAQRRWHTQSEQRDWTLQTARALECDWLLAIDADEELHNRSSLRPWLEAWGYDAFPIPFYFSPQASVPCPFKCLHIPDWRRYVCQGSMLESWRGETVRVMGHMSWHDPAHANLPYLTHRPELRPEARRGIRLSERETALEPAPDDVRAWREPVYAPRLLDPDNLYVGEVDPGLPVWRCPACGRRYAGPGSCAREHAPTGLLRLEMAAA